MKNVDDNIKSGLNYLIPKRWWCALNQINPSESSAELPSIRTYMYFHPTIHRNTYVLDFKEHIKKNIQNSTQVSYIDDVFVCPQIKPKMNWKIISPESWSSALSLTEELITIPIIYRMEQPNEYFEEESVKVEILFRSEQKTTLFVGFFPPNQNLSIIVEEIGKMLGFWNFINSYIRYLEFQFPQDLSFQYLGALTPKQVQQTLIIKGLFHSSSPVNEQFIFQPLPQLRRYHSEENSNDRRSLSTKMDTPKRYGIQQCDEIGRIYKIIHSTKQPQQIQLLREKVERSFSQGEIYIPTQMNEQILRGQLEEIARQFLSRISQQ